MKRLFAILIIIVSLLNVSACSNEQQNDNDVSNDENMYDAFIGTWAEEEIGWEFGGLIIDIFVTDENMEITCSLTQSAPASRVAEFTQSFKLADIKNSVVEIPYDNDGWGNSGTLEITFNENVLFCDFKNIANDGYAAMWGFYEKTYKLVKNEKAHELLVYTQEEYDAKYGEPEVGEQPEYNESDVSALENIRNNCLMLEWAVYSSDFDSDTTLNPCTRSELKDNPEIYIDQYFVPCETLTEFVVCPDCMGSGFYHGIAERGSCFNKGYRSIDKTENGTHYILQEYLDQAALKPISISDIYVDVTGSVIYKYDPSDDYFVDYIYDMREDKSISITEDTLFVPYMVFLGEVDSNLKFGLIDCDIIE